MRVCVVGLTHLGVVTAACLAAVGHDVVGVDIDAETVAGLRRGEAPVREPGLDELLAAPAWSDEPVDADLLVLAYDTPVDDEDRADVAWVLERFAHFARRARPGTLVIVSSQLPVGTVAQLERAWPGLAFACVPESLRLGAAVRSFLEPERVVAGVRSESDREQVAALLAPVTERIEWMSIESAEMVKHALNAFLATSIALGNEVATACEAVGADAREVERGVRGDARVGARAPISPGGAFAGGTLARDVRYLVERHAGSVLLPAVLRSNEQHKQWVRRALERALGELDGRTVAVWGLAYKPESDSTRRSESVELCRWLAAAGATVRAHDPAVRSQPGLALCEGALEAADGAHALVVSTAWREYRELPAEAVVARMAQPAVVDAGGFLSDTLGRDPRVRYLTVGAPWAS